MSEKTWLTAWPGTLGAVLAAKHGRNDNAVYWTSPLGTHDDFGSRYGDEMIDGRTVMGPWANMTPRSWRKHGVGRFGTGYGQRYERQADGRWLKVEG